MAGVGLPDLPGLGKTVHEATKSMLLLYDVCALCCGSSCIYYYFLPTLVTLVRRRSDMGARVLN